MYSLIRTEIKQRPVRTKAENMALSDMMKPYHRALLNGQLSAHIYPLEENLDDDLHRIGDYTVATTVQRRYIGVRTRFACGYRDFTIRAEVPGGYDTELHKLQAGRGDFYLYTWANDARDGFNDWLFLDLHKIRAANLLAQAHPAPYDNADQTKWVYLTLKQLWRVDAILAWSENLPRRIMEQIYDVGQQTLFSE